MATERPGTDVFLPSKGLPYQGQIPQGLISVYSMTTTDEKMFAGISKKLDFENVIDKLIRRCSSIPEKMRPDELYVGDRVFLMMNIRAVSYGADYGFKVSCPECTARWDQNIDITKDLDIRDVSDDHEDPFKLELPLSHDTVTLRLFRGSDERAIVRFVDQANKKLNIQQVGDPGYVYRLALHVVSVDFHETPDKSFSQEALEARPNVLVSHASEFIESLNAADSSAIREELDARTPGMVLAMELDCPKCNHHFDLGLPLTADFFRAKPATGLRTTARVVSRKTQ